MRPVGQGGLEHTHSLLAVAFQAWRLEVCSIISGTLCLLEMCLVQPSTTNFSLPAFAVCRDLNEHGTQRLVDLST